MASLDLSERPRLLAAGAQHGAQQLTPRAGRREDLPPRAGPSATTRSQKRSWSLCAVRRLGPADLVDLSAAAGRRGRVDGGRRAVPHADAGGQRRRPRCLTARFRDGRCLGPLGLRTDCSFLFFWNGHCVRQEQLEGGTRAAKRRAAVSAFSVCLGGDALTSSVSGLFAGGTSYKACLNRQCVWFRRTMSAQT